MRNAEATPTHSKTSKRHRWIPESFRKFGRDQSGTAAIEMSFILLPFTFTLVIIFEVTLQYFALGAIKTGLADLARQVRTNQINTGNFDLAQAKAIVCREGFVMLDCSKMKIDVQEVGSWNSPAVPKKPDGTLDGSGMGFAPGERESINIVRAYYEWEAPATGFLTYEFYASHQANVKILVATEALRIEP